MKSVTEANPRYLSIEGIKDMITDRNSNTILDYFYGQWQAVNDEIHQLSLVRNSLEEIMDAVYDAGSNDLQNHIHQSIKDMSKIYSIKEGWKDKWGFDNWVKSYDISVKRDKGSLQI